MPYLWIAEDSSAVIVLPVVAVGGWAAGRLGGASVTEVAESRNYFGPLNP